MGGIGNRSEKNGWKWKSKMLLQLRCSHSHHKLTLACSWRSLSTQLSYYLSFLYWIIVCISHSLVIRSDELIEHLSAERIEDRGRWRLLALEVVGSAVRGLLMVASGVLPVPSIGLAERCLRCLWETTRTIESVIHFKFIFNSSFSLLQNIALTFLSS